MKNHQPEVRKANKRGQLDHRADRYHRKDVRVVVSVKATMGSILRLKNEGRLFDSPLSVLI